MDNKMKVVHIFGNKERFPEIKNGQILYEVDSGELFIDVNNQRRLVNPIDELKQMIEHLNDRINYNSYRISENDNSIIWLENASPDLDVIKLIMEAPDGAKVKVTNANTTAWCADQVKEFYNKLQNMIGVDGDNAEFNGTITVKYMNDGEEADIPEHDGINIEAGSSYDILATFKRQDKDGGGYYYATSVESGTAPEYKGEELKSVREGNYVFDGFAPAVSDPIYESQLYKAVFRNDDLQTIKYLRAELESYESKNITSIRDDAFNNQTSLKLVDVPNVTIIGHRAFQNCTSLETIKLGDVQSIGQLAFGSCDSLKSLVFDADELPQIIPNNIYYASNYETYFHPLRELNCAIYVKDSILDQCKANENINKFLILPLSAYPCEETLNLDTQFSYLSTITDTWEEIIENNNYINDYQLGDTKALYLGKYGVVVMELVAFDLDDKSSESGKARMTWISKNLIYLENVFTRTNYKWEQSNLRQYLNNDFMDYLPLELKNNIVSVQKKSCYSSNKTPIITHDYIWIPSQSEVFSDASTIYETDAPQYSNIFNSNESRIKYFENTSSVWGLRSYALESIVVRANGTQGPGSTSNTYQYYPICFCI